MQFLNNKTTVILSLCGGALTILASYYLSNPSILIFSSLLFFLSLILWKFGYLLSPLISQTLNLKISGSDFELTPQQDILITKIQNGFHATSFLSIELNESSQFKSDAQKGALMEMFERALTSLKFPLKLSFLICNIDLSEHLQKLQERRSLAEHRKSQESNSAQISQLEREIKYYDSQIERLSSGERPMQILAFAKTSSTGLSKEEAATRARAQAKEASATLANALGASIRVLSGEDLLNCTKWEQTPPTTKDEISSQLF